MSKRKPTLPPPAPPVLPLKFGINLRDGLRAARVNDFLAQNASHTRNSGILALIDLGLSAAAFSARPHPVGRRERGAK